MANKTREEINKEASEEFTNKRIASHISKEERVASEDEVAEYEAEQQNRSNEREYHDGELKSIKDSDIYTEERQPVQKFNDNIERENEMMSSEDELAEYEAEQLNRSNVNEYGTQEEIKRMEEGKPFQIREATSREEYAEAVLQEGKGKEKDEDHLQKTLDGINKKIAEETSPEKIEALKKSAEGLAKKIGKGTIQTASNFSKVPGKFYENYKKYKAEEPQRLKREAQIGASRLTIARQNAAMARLQPRQQSNPFGNAGFGSVFGNQGTGLGTNTPVFGKGGTEKQQFIKEVIKSNGKVTERYIPIDRYQTGGRPRVTVQQQPQNFVEQQAPNFGEQQPVINQNTHLPFMGGGQQRPKYVRGSQRQPNTVITITTPNRGRAIINRNAGLQRRSTIGAGLMANNRVARPQTKTNMGSGLFSQQKTTRTPSRPQRIPFGGFKKQKRGLW